ncbi:MAG: tetratricopeptide repeat protein, partial [Bacteroidales bacterium]|nr:tetratricopeptide repeat protein [Bacteroidales bacterium]
MTPIVTRLCSLTFVLVCALGLTIKSPKETRLLNEATHRISIKSRNMDSLAMLANTYIAVDSLEEAILVFRQMGKVARESNTFMKAIEYHNKALELAETIGDEDGIILCLNQLGTDYRRIAAYEEATNYHYRALQRCGQYRGEPEFALKHKVISLNGIGNIYRKLNNLDEAESLFRQALVGETQLKSYLGMAINYANIGAILEARHQYDSAHVYYERSMEYNRLENSQLGISLCYISFGRLAEAKGDYTTALREYHAAYDIMDKTADRTQWLKACLSIVRVNIAKGDMNNALLYLGRAEKTALALNANDHLATVYDLKYRYFEKKGDFRQALNSYATAKRYADSTLNLTNVNHINDLRMFYETSKREAEISALKGEKRLTLWIGFSGGTILLLFAVTFFFFWRWTKGRKRIAEQEVKRQKQDQELIASQAMFDGELQERTRLARDLHDRMGGTL